MISRKNREVIMKKFLKMIRKLINESKIYNFDDTFLLELSSKI